jgi:chorismate lyase/3-hydroxybenzoate synthase
MGDINAGEADAERYKQFSVGRARAFADADAQSPGMPWPAATAVGTLDGRRRLLVCWLAGTEAGDPVENPRQVNAYCHPRQYGPASPRFSRAMLAPEGTLLVSGTASIVGHDSLHVDDVTAQLEETLRNLDAVTAKAGLQRQARACRVPLLTVFLRRPGDAAWVAQRLRDHYRAEPRFVILDAAICRPELLLEIEAIG